MRLAAVTHLIGVLVRLFGITLAAPLGVALYYGNGREGTGFAVSTAATVIAGHLMCRAGGEAARRGVERLRRVEGLAVVSGTWLIVAIFASLPYMWVGLSPVDAMFESMSGLTTTGATIFRDFSRYGEPIFFWRALTHWIGGLGVIALFVAILPRLAIGGRELFFAEAPGPTDEQLTPHIRQTALALWKVYAALTVAEIVALAAVGMPIFDAVCNAMATLAAGGFSPNPLSIAGYHNPAAEWIVTAFMFAAGGNFALQYRALKGNPRALTGDEEFRAYTGVVLVASLALAGLLVESGMAGAAAVRHAFFQVLSILTTSGFASVDFQQWTDQAKVILLLIMFIGGCAGSAGGGPKVVRHVLMARFTIRELTRALHPRAVLPVKLGGRVVPDDIMRSVVVFMLFYMLTFALGAAIVVALGADLVTGISASIACLGNIGPGFNLVGPMSSYATLHPLSRIVLTLEMWIGRLEVITVLVLFRWDLWRTSRWSAE